MALASINKFVKEDLKRSVSGFFYCVFVHRFTNLSTWQQPLRDTEAGKGKRSRDVEKYLEGLLREIRPVESTPTPAGAESDVDNTTAAAFSRREYFFSSFRLDIVN
jgi:hypothetical protein